MGDLTRRHATAVIAATAVVTWLGLGKRAEASATRLRAGGRLTLRCNGATSFHLQFAEYGDAQVPAPGGAATFRVPFPETTDEWTPLRCTPVDQNGPLGPATEVLVLTAPIRFGA